MYKRYSVLVLQDLDENLALLTPSFFFQVYFPFLAKKLAPPKVLGFQGDSSYDS